jgi:hypothetical protein
MKKVDAICREVGEGQIRSVSGIEGSFSTHDELKVAELEVRARFRVTVEVGDSF